MSSVKISNLTKKQADMFVSWFTEIGVGRDSFNDFLITNDVKSIEEDELKWNVLAFDKEGHINHEIIIKNKQ